MNKIPLVDLHAQYLSIKSDIDTAIESSIKNSSFIGGEAVKTFEGEFAKCIRVKNVISCANGTDSIEILLKAYGIKKGDEVIVPAISWISTSEAVSSLGATPVFVDIEEDYYTINPSLIEGAITSKTKAIIPVHLYGNPANMPQIMSIAAKHKLIVIEDCAQSPMAKIDGKIVGTIGNAASFSFFPGKNLGAYGDAGCMATNDDSIAETVRMIANHGQKGKHNHIIEGRNSRLDGLQAAILSAKLPYLNNWTTKRIEHSKAFSKLIVNQHIKKPLTRANAKHVFHLYVIRTVKRDELKTYLQTHNIDSAIHYPTALPFLPCYKLRNFKPADFPVAALYQDEILSIPMFPELMDEQIKFISEKLNNFCENN